MAAEMYLASLLVADEQSFMERAYLDELARQLKLEPSLRAELEAQVRQDSMGRFLKSLGLERLWQVTGDQQVQEGWYSAALGVTVITKATTGSSASLTARVMDGQVTSPALSAAGQ